MKQEINRCVEVLKAGGTILNPTDTVWGIGCDATNADAVEKIYFLKKRMESRSLIILLDVAEKIPDYAGNIPEIAWDILKSVETPLTIIYPNAKNLAKNVIGTDHSIAIRIVKNEFCQALIAAFGKPIVSTSANFSGERTPLTFKDIPAEIISNVDYVVKHFREEIHYIKPSRIIKLEENGEFKIIRK